MNLDDIAESGVTDLQSFKNKQREKNLNALNNKISQAKEQHLNGIDHAVAAAIDNLSRSMPEDEANAAVFRHLSDLVMIYDLSK
jgi:hypothetical protein